MPPYDTTSKPGQRWMEGRHEGQRQAREDLQRAMEKRNAAHAPAEEQAFAEAAE